MLRYSNLCFLVVDLDHTVRVIQKGVIFHLQYISQRWKNAGQYFPGAVNTCAVLSKCTAPVTKFDRLHHRDPKFVTLFCLLYILMPTKQW